MPELLQQEANLSQAQAILRRIAMQTVNDSLYGYQMVERAVVHLRRQHEAVSIQVSEYFTEVA